MAEPQWQKALLAGLGAAGVAAAVYYCMKDSKKQSSSAPVSKDAPTTGKTRVEDISKEVTQTILKEIIESQDKMKGYMKELTKELRAKKLSFDETYKRVREVQPSDPLEKHHLSMMDFDQLLDKYQGDPNVRESISKIMGAPNPTSTVSEKVQGITVKEIIRIHTFMYEELEKLTAEYEKKKNSSELDAKTVTIVAQAIVGAKMEEQFGITSEDIENAVLMYHTILATDQEFANINTNIQHTMGKLMATP